MLIPMLLNLVQSKRTACKVDIYTLKASAISQVFRVLNVGIQRPIKLISNSVSKFLLEKNLRSLKVGVFWLYRGFFSSYCPSPSFSHDFEHFSIVWFLWNLLWEFVMGYNLWRLYIFLFKIFPSLPTLPTTLNTLPLADLDAIWYVDVFWDGICDVYIFSLQIFPNPDPYLRSHPELPPGFKQFPIVQLRLTLACRLIF